MTGHFTAGPHEFILESTGEAPSLEANKKPATFNETLKLYLSTSTILGVNFIYSSPYIVQRCAWMMIVFLGLCATGYHSFIHVLCA